MRRYIFVLLAGLWGLAPAWAGTWADNLFDEVSKDFGAVPRGPMLSHPFQLTNKTDQPLHISNVRVSCGCVSASAYRQELAPGESTVIQAYMDTRRFSGHKSVTVYVAFDRPQFDEARLLVRADGRDDLYLEPDGFSFGTIQRGSAPSATVNVTFANGGQWQISEVEPESKYVQPGVKELQRTAGQTTYRVSATIGQDIPAGKWYTELWLKTNNPSMPRVRIPLTVEVAAKAK